MDSGSAMDAELDLGTRNGIGKHCDITSWIILKMADTTFSAKK